MKLADLQAVVVAALSLEARVVDRNEKRPGSFGGETDSCVGSDPAGVVVARESAAAGVAHFENRVDRRADAAGFDLDVEPLAGLGVNAVDVLVWAAQGGVDRHGERDPLRRASGIVKRNMLFEFGFFLDSLRERADREEENVRDALFRFDANRIGADGGLGRDLQQIRPASHPRPLGRQRRDGPRNLAVNLELAIESSADQLQPDGRAALGAGGFKAGEGGAGRGCKRGNQN